MYNNKYLFYSSDLLPFIKHLNFLLVTVRVLLFKIIILKQKLFRIISEIQTKLIKNPDYEGKIKRAGNLGCFAESRLKEVKHQLINERLTVKMAL